MRCNCTTLSVLCMCVCMCECRSGRCKPLHLSLATRVYWLRLGSVIFVVWQRFVFEGLHRQANKSQQVLRFVPLLTCWLVCWKYVLNFDVTLICLVYMFMQSAYVSVIAWLLCVQSLEFGFNVVSVDGCIRLCKLRQSRFCTISNSCYEWVSDWNKAAQGASETSKNWSKTLLDRVNSG